MLKGEITQTELTPDDFHLNLQQKGVDTRIGIDIANVALNQYADTIVLLASDADFVPVAKLARKQGVDVILDPLFGNVSNQLQKHVDGKKSYDLVSAISRELDNLEPTPIPIWWDSKKSISAIAQA